MIANPDIVVIGLGPAGSRAAASAAAAGWRVVALERKSRAGRPVQCAEFIPAMLDQELEGLGAVTVQNVHRMFTFVEGEPGDETRDFNGRMIDRAAFDARLAEAAAQAVTDCRYGVALRRVDGDGVCHLADGTVLRPRVLIGADGPRSRAGLAIGQANTALVETRQIAVPLKRAHDGTDIFLRADMPGGYGWFFPKGAIANLGLGLEPRARHLLRPLLDRLHRQLVAEGRVGDEVLSHTGGPIPVGGRLEPIGGLRETVVLLAGDAAPGSPLTDASSSASSAAAPRSSRSRDGSPALETDPGPVSS